MPILRNIIVGAARTADEMKQICARGNLTVSDLENSDLKLSLQQNCALMDAALQLSGDRDLGLHIGERTTSSVLGVTGYLMESSKDFLTALLPLLVLSPTNCYPFLPLLVLSPTNRYPL